MTFDEMLEVWRTQDTAPPYRVNPDLLAVVVRQEHAELRRESGWDLWFLPWALWMAAGAMLVIVVTFLVVANLRGWATPSVWDYVATGIAIVAMLVWPGVYWASYRRQPSRERGFGNSLQEEIRRNLARVDHHLSRFERLGPSLLLFAPFGVVVILCAWVVFRANGGPVTFQTTFFIVAFSMLAPLAGTSRALKKGLLEQRRRLSQLLDLLNAGE
jgi:hypothetical protein